MSIQLSTRVLHVKDNGEYDTIDVLRAPYKAVDSELSSTSENPVQNKVVKQALDEKVDDVQINGTSIISNGVAEIPKSSADVLGVVKPSYGVKVDENGVLTTAKSLPAWIKGGGNSYGPIVPDTQHIATFYGLAKIAGADMASSSNPAGTYTDEAKIAIQKMLGIYEPPFELIENYTFTEEGGFDRTVEPNGTPYNFRSVFIYIFYPADLTTATTGFSRYRCADSTGVYVNAETGKYATKTATCFKKILTNRRGNMFDIAYTRQATSGDTATWYTKGDNSFRFDMGNITRVYIPGDDVEPAGTNIKIYAQRAY